MPKKDDFKNPALDYLTIPGGTKSTQNSSTKRTAKSDIQKGSTDCTEDTKTTGDTTAQTPPTLLLNKEERKTKSIQLRLRPSTYKRLQAAAEYNQMSVNAAIDRIIENFLSGVGST